MKILAGNVISSKIKQNIKANIARLKTETLPQLAVINIGNNYASNLYVTHKIAACKDVGIITQVIHFQENISENSVINKILELNQDDLVHGILVQLPLPIHINQLKVLNSININKDVDGLTCINAGKLLQGDDTAIIPCTVKGIISLLKAYRISVKNKNVTIINNSNLIGKPLAMILNNKGATVSILHKETKNLTNYLLDADIICSATGVKNLFSSSQIKTGAVIIDIAINKSTDNKTVIGDVDFQDMKTKASAITPVPGGIGPMTIAMLLENLMLLYNIKNKNKQ